MFKLSVSPKVEILISHRGCLAALAEIDSLIGNEPNQKWLKVSSSAILLPTHESQLLNTLDTILRKQIEPD